MFCSVYIAEVTSIPCSLSMLASKLVQYSSARQGCTIAGILSTLIVDKAQMASNMHCVGNLLHEHPCQSCRERRVDEEEKFDFSRSSNSAVRLGINQALEPPHAVRAAGRRMSTSFPVPHQHTFQSVLLVASCVSPTRVVSAGVCIASRSVDHGARGLMPLDSELLSP